MKKGISLFFQILIFLAAVLSITGLSYIIGKPYLTGSNLLGNDAYSFYSVVLWVNKYFPHVPFWYPLAGGGVSISSGYPVFAAYLIAIITRISSLDLVQSFRFIGFLSVPMLALGVFFLVLLRLTDVKNGVTRAVLGLIAAGFVVVSPSSWLWLTRWGFYAESISYIFVPWVILFFDLFLENAIEGKRGWGYRIGLLGSSVFLLLSLLTHFLSVASLAVFFGLVALVRMITSKSKKVIFRRMLGPGILLVILFGGISFFKITQYEFYMNQVSLGGFSGYGKMAYSEMANNTLPLSMMLSLKSPTTIMDSHALIFDMRFPLYVWILFAVGFILSFRKSKKIFSFGIYGALGLILSSVLSIRYFVSGIPLISTVANLMEGRGYLIVARVIVPIVAVYGAYIVWETLFKKLIPKINFINELLSLVFTVGGVAILVNLFYNSPYKLPFMIGTGFGTGVIDVRDIWNKMPYPSSFLYSEDVELVSKNPEYTTANFAYMSELCIRSKMTLVDSDSICDTYLQKKDLVYPPTKLITESKAICTKEKKNGEFDEKYQFCKAFYLPLSEQLLLKNWPGFSISPSISKEEKSVNDLMLPLPTEEKYRYDLSGFTGGAIMATPLVTKNSQIQLYINTLSLIYNSWNYQSQVMYSNLASTQKPGVLTELGKWFGLNYVYLTGSDLEPKSYWQSDSNWEKFGSPEILSGWKKFNIPVSLATWDNRPKILVVTDVKRGLYDQIFRFATWGAIPFDEANIIIGKNSIDSYSLSNLKNYDAIIMRGYSYNSKSKAYNLLNQYVKGGGKLIFDTGWQFEVPDYILDKAPEFMPFDSLVWQNLDVNSKFSVSPDFAGVDTSKFGDLKYGDSSWGVSIAQNLKSWANIDLSYDGKPLVVSGKYGKGDVAWIGFNIIAHAIAKDNTEEAKFFNGLVTNILGNKQISNLNTVYTRISPDKAEFDLQSSTTGNSGIYFRESYFPYWKAYLQSGNKKTNLKIEKAGPGFMYISLPPVTSGDKVILQIQISIQQKIADTISVAFGILALITFAKPNLFSFVKLPKIKIKLPNSGLSKNENEDY